MRSLHASRCRRAPSAKSISRTRTVPGGAVGRLGGDEFLAVLPTVDLEVAVAIARQCVDAVERTDIGVSASIGVSTATRGEAVDAILRRADEAMYCAKASGPGNVHVSEAAEIESVP